MIDLLTILSLFGSLFGAIGTTILVFWDSKHKKYGIWVWLFGNGAMLWFTWHMQYYDQMAMWVYYEIVNVGGLLNEYTNLFKRFKREKTCT